MPGMDGLQALAELGDWPGSRVLLTGQADEQVAVRAFNRGLIDQFIPKQTPDISRRLIEAVERLLVTPHARHAQTWRATLSPEQNALLRAPRRATTWLAYCGQALGRARGDRRPFRRARAWTPPARSSWLQLETRATAWTRWRNWPSSPACRPPAWRTSARARKLADLELRQALGRRAAARSWLPRSASARTARLLGALFPVEPPTGPDPDNSYSRLAGAPAEAARAGLRRPSVLAAARAASRRAIGQSHGLHHRRHLARHRFHVRHLGFGQAGVQRQAHHRAVAAGGRRAEHGAEDAARLHRIAQRQRVALRARPPAR